MYLIQIVLLQESPAVRKRLAVLECELRKVEASKKTYEVATEKLIWFAEVRIIHLVILVWPTSWTPALGGLFVCE